MIQSSANDQADVLFLVEGTAINGAYIHDMKVNYIQPTIEVFSTQPNIVFKDSQGEEDVFSVDKSNVMYGIVIYRTAQAMPGTCCSTYGPFTNTQKLVNTIDNLSLTGGKSESYANMAEGMAVAMQCFEDFAEIRSAQRGSNASPATPQKHVIMICNSAPYAMPVPVGQQFEMKNFEQLAMLFHENNINLSILSPRKIPILFKIFEKAGGDLVNNTKNYCKDPRHLVLLKGYSLKERPISPTVTNAISISSPLQNATAPIANTAGGIDANSGMATEQVQQQQANMRPDYQFQMNNQNNIRPNMMGQPNQIQQPQPLAGGMVGNVQGNQMFNNMMNRPMAPNVARRMPGPGMNPQQMQGANAMGQAQQQQPNMGQMNPQQMQPNQQQNSSALISQLSIMPQSQSNVRMQFMNNPNQAQQQQMANKPGMAGNPSGAPDQAQPPQQQQQQQQQPTQPTAPVREKIWTGVLEYMDKANRITRQISAYATCAVKDGEPEVKADNWPAKLFTQLLPKQAMTTAASQFAKDSKSVLFIPTSADGMECFVQNTNNAGCIHFKNCNELKVAVLLYLPERKHLVGLIPNNQTLFLERLRKTYSDNQAQQQALQQQQQAQAQAQAAQQQQQQQQQQMQQGLNQGPGNMMEGSSGGGDANVNNNQMMQPQQQQQMVGQQPQNDGQFRNFQMNPQQQPQMGNPQMMNDFVPMQRMVRPVMANNQMQGNMNPQQGQMNFQMNPQQQPQMTNPQMMNDFVPMQQRMVRPQNNQLRHLLQRQPQFNPGMQGVNPQQAGGIQQQNPNVGQMQQQQNFDQFDF